MKKREESCKKPLRGKLQGPSLVLSVFVLMVLPIGLSLGSSIDSAKLPASMMCILICAIFAFWHSCGAYEEERSLSSKETRRNSIMCDIYGMLLVTSSISLLAKMALS